MKLDPNGAAPAHAVETYLAWRETEEIKSDPETWRAVADTTRLVTATPGQGRKGR